MHNNANIATRLNLIIINKRLRCEVKTHPEEVEEWPEIRNLCVFVSLTSVYRNLRDRDVGARIKNILHSRLISD